MAEVQLVRLLEYRITHQLEDLFSAMVPKKRFWRSALSFVSRCLSAR